MFVYRYTLAFTLLLFSYFTLAAQHVRSFELLVHVSKGKNVLKEDLECLRQSLDIPLQKDLGNGLQLWDWSTPGSTKYTPAEVISLVRSVFPDAFVQPNYLYQLSAIPNDNLFNNQWNMYNKGDGGCNTGADIGVVDAWDIGTGDSTLIIAVIDGGMDLDHEDLIANRYRNPMDSSFDGRDQDGNGLVDDVYGWDFVNDSLGSNGSRYNGGRPEDDTHNGHGTHVAGIVGARGNNQSGIAGVCWNCKLLPIKFSDSTGKGNTLTAISAINYIADLKESGVNIKVANNSWGGTANDLLLYQAIQRLDSLGVLFVAASGNANQNNNDQNPYYPASFDLPNIISVTSTNCHDILASSANIGLRSVDIAAPGVGILSTLPNDQYGFLSGTSMAAPHVAGAVGLMYSLSSGLTPFMIKQRLIDLADPIPHLADKCLSGSRLNINRALTDNSITTFQQTYSFTNYEIRFNDIVEDGDGNYYLSGYVDSVVSGSTKRSDVFIQKVNGQGQVIWAKTVGGNLGEANISMVLAPDSGVIICSDTRSFTIPIYEVLMFQFDPNGQKVWEKLIHFNGKALPLTIARTNDRGLIQTGNSELDSSVVFLMKTDSIGNIEWFNTYSDSNITHTFGVSVTPLQNGEYLLLGRQRIGSILSPIMIKTDSIGQVIWSRTTFSATNVFSKAIETTSGKLLVLSFEDFGLSTGRDLFVYQLSQNGEIEWGQRFSSSLEDLGLGLAENKNGNYFISGYSQDVTDATAVALTMEIDINGNLQWISATEPLSGLNLSRDGLQTSDGGFGICGTNDSLAFFIKTDIYGSSGCLTDIATQVIQVPIPKDSITWDSLGLFATPGIPAAIPLVLDPFITDVTSSIQTTTNCISSVDCNLTVTFPPPDPSICLGETVTFASQSSGADTLYWYINDTLRSQADTFSYTFNHIGEFEIRLKGVSDTCSLSSTQHLLVRTPVRLNLGADTTTIAPSYFLNAATPNGRTYLWTNSNSDTVANTSYIGITRSGTYTLQVQDACGDTAIDSIHVNLIGNGLFMVPGDVNADGLINMVDWFLLTTQHGNLGIPRINPSSLPIPQRSQDWSISFPNGHFLADSVNLKHADVDGDSILSTFIDGPKAIANFNSIHPNLTTPLSPYSIHIQAQQSSVTLGDSIYFSFIIENQGGVDSLLGIALSLHPSILLTNPPTLASDSSIWGQAGVDYNQDRYVDSVTGRIDFGFARMDQQPVVTLGFRQFARSGIITQIDDIDDPWLFAALIPITFTPGNVLLFGKNSLVPVNSVSVQSTITVMVEIPSDLVFAKVRAHSLACSDKTVETTVEIAEKNAQKITLLHSSDGLIWAKGDSVMGKNDTTTLASSYTFMHDVDPLLTANGDTLYYQLQIEGPQGEVYHTTIWSQIVTGCELSTAITAQVAQKGFQVFPNPTRDQLSIEFAKPFETPGKLSLIDLAGKPVRKYAIRGNRVLRINVKDLPEGIYFLTYHSEGQKPETKKVIIHH